MKYKCFLLSIAIILLPACATSNIKPVIVKEKIQVSQELLEECPQLVFAPVENTQDCWNVLKVILTQYTQCTNRLNQLQSTVKEFNK